MLVFSGVKKITVATAKKILRELLNDKRKTEDRIYTVLGIYSGKSKPQLIDYGKSKCTNLFEVIERQVSPKNIKPVNNRYINSGATLIEFDFDTSRLKKMPEFTDIDKWDLETTLNNIESVLSHFAVRYRKESYKPVWEEANRDEVKTLLSGAGWRQVLESYLYLKSPIGDIAYGVL